MLRPYYSRLSIYNLSIILFLMMIKALIFLPKYAIIIITTVKDKMMALVKTENEDDNLSIGTFCRNKGLASKAKIETPKSFLRRVISGYIKLSNTTTKTSHIDWTRKI